MDKKNLTIFLAILVVMVALVGTDMISPGLDIEKVGRPVVRPPLSYDKDYKIIPDGNEVVVELSPEVAEEYNGRFLSVYAYDKEGNHISKLKRVVNGKILIDGRESASFKVSFIDGSVSIVDKGDKESSFNQILKGAMDNDKLHGLGRCLLGKQCIKICPVAAAYALMKDTSPEGRGRIIPNIDYTKCIQGGLCANKCPTNLLIVDENEPE